jgi:HTH-type transcriptional regulator/antitoxin HigA
MLHSKNTIAVQPGATIREQLENRGMRQKDFALRMGMSEKHISRLINGKVELTSDVALRLESVLGLPAKFWNNMESNYREQLSRVEAELDMEKDEEIASKFPYAKLASLGWIPITRKKNEKVKNLRAFFEVAKLGLLDDLRIPGIAYRINGTNSKSNYSLAAWAQKARIEMRNEILSDINIEKLKISIPEIRNLTTFKPDDFCKKLKDILSTCGVAIIFLPHIDGSFLHGASFIDGKHIVLGLTVRGKDSDRFWFSLFHELYHIIEGHINRLEPTTIEQEHSADLFAKDTLILPSDYELFIKNSNYSKRDIVEFANMINIDPGIVLGRLQKENLVPYNRFHDLKTQYKIT